MPGTIFPFKATHARTRAHNSSLVLRAIYDLGPISRADIARLTGLTRTSVGELVADLEGDGLARDAGKAPSRGGKAATLVELVPDARHVITLDLGERAFRAALVDLRGEIVHRAGRDRRGAEGDAAVALVYDLVDEVLAGPSVTVLGIGVGTPGIVAADGMVRWAVDLAWRDLPLAALLRERYAMPAVVVNDARAAALGRYLFSGEDRPDNMIAVRVGRGIGAGLILRGVLFNGDDDGAGEIGHVVVDPDGAQCHCGRFGCLESLASATALVRAADQAGLPVSSMAELSAVAGQGDEIALGLIRAAGRALGSAIANIVGTLDVHEIVLHGSVTVAGEPWLAAVRDETTRRSLGPLVSETHLVDGGIGEDLTLEGACALVLTSELGLTVHG